ncbi:hypothetical protein EYF80_040407 [Liparis tanakae]|uniref:Uncharacterized protein n=1 Tax=Liparis tanakae TaxID=230148 RepID=A0A4Z2G8J2_9TELE|nr:hypothetical protein EYF80_040407 [Liparis tanakae]
MAFGPCPGPSDPVLVGKNSGKNGKRPSGVQQSHGGRGPIQREALRLEAGGTKEAGSMRKEARGRKQGQGVRAQEPVLPFSSSTTPHTYPGSPPPPVTASSLVREPPEHPLDFETSSHSSHALCRALR